MSVSHTENIDCMEFMARYPDKFFELAIVDPPYGIGANWEKGQKGSIGKHDSTYRNDKIPSSEYFEELFRVSKNRIIWGGNYYTQYLPPTNNLIIWDKGRSFKDSLMSEGEIAWHDYHVPLRIARFMWIGAITCEPKKTKHPHEKPSMLYKWCLSEYAKPGQKILDTHLGSGSSRIAAYDLGFDFYGTELDKDYFDAQEKRFATHIAQGRLFEPEEVRQPDPQLFEDLR